MVVRFFTDFCEEIFGTEFDVINLEQRGIGDLIQAEASRIFAQLVDAQLGFEHAEASSRRSPEDFSISNGEVFVMFDVKTHEVGADFSMPNLISIERLWNILEDEEVDIYYIFIDYNTDGDNATIEHVEIRHVTNLSLEDLRIGNLGKGQLQISNGANRVRDSELNPNEWMRLFVSMAVEHNESLIEVVEERIILWQEREQLLD